MKLDIRQPHSEADEALRRKWRVSQLQSAMREGMLSDSMRFELIAGELLPMSPQFIPHGWVKAELGFWLRMHVSTGLSVLQEVSLQLSDTTLLEPDIALCRLNGLPRRYLLAQEVALVVEIADSTARTDRIQKPALYAAAMIPHVWVVDLTSQTTLTHEQPTEDGYQLVREVPFTQALDLPTEITDPAIQIIIADFLPQQG